MELPEDTGDREWAHEAVRSAVALQISDFYILASVYQRPTGQTGLRERLPWSGHWPVSQTMRQHVTCCEETLSPKAFSALGPVASRKWLGCKISCFVFLFSVTKLCELVCWRELF